MLILGHHFRLGNTEGGNVDLHSFERHMLSNNTADRDIRKAIRSQLLEEIARAARVDLDALGRQTGVRPFYTGDKSKGSLEKKRAADTAIMAIFVREWANMDEDEKDEAAHWYNNICERSEVRKRLSGLDHDQNEEFQTLINRMREEGDLPDEERVRLMQLDYMRSNPGTAPEQAHAVAAQKYAQVMARDDGEQLWVNYTTKLAKQFLRGRSANITKDTIQYAQRGRNNNGGNDGR